MHIEDTNLKQSLNTYRKHHGLPPLEITTLCLKLNHHPGIIPESSFFSHRELKREYSLNYFTEDDKRIAYAKTKPAYITIPKEGSWRFDDIEDPDAKSIDALVSISADDPRLVFERETPRLRIDEVIRYKQWMLSGLIPPPIWLKEDKQGTLIVKDGRVRIMALKGTARPILAWVSVYIEHKNDIRRLTSSLAQDVLKDSRHRIQTR